MAEGIANKFTCFQAFSAGTKKSSLIPYAEKVMSMYIDYAWSQLSPYVLFCQEDN